MAVMTVMTVLVSLAGKQAGSGVPGWGLAWGTMEMVDGIVRDPGSSMSSRSHPEVIQRSAVGGGDGKDERKMIGLGEGVAASYERFAVDWRHRRATLKRALVPWHEAGRARDGGGIWVDRHVP